MKIVIVFLALTLTACAGDIATRSTVALALACDSYATVLDELTPMRKAGKLSAAAIGRVDKANAALKPVCSKNAIVDPAEGVAIVTQAIGLLKSIRGN